MTVFSEPKIPVPEGLRRILEIEVKTVQPEAVRESEYVISIRGAAETAEPAPEKPEPIKCSAAFTTVLGSADRAEAVKAFSAAKKFKGSDGEVKSFFSAPAHTVLLAGVGEAPAVTESWFRLGEKVGDAVYEDDPKTVTVHVCGSAKPGAKQLAAFLQRLLYASVRSQGYKSKPDAPRSLSSVQVVLDEGLEGVPIPVEQLKAAAYASAVAAVLVDAPPNYCNGPNFVEFVRERIAELKLESVLEVTVLDEQACAERKMGAFLAVAQGSRYGARLLHLKYKGPKASGRPVVLVGKGITMDTGGYSVKPSNAMVWMKCDMGGAAGVTSTLLYLALTRPEAVEVHSVAMLCENMIDADAYRVGDIVTAGDGQTIEIQNTDAEGRLALCDGLVYAQNVTDNKAVVIDCATLTGAALVALGDAMTAVYANSDHLRNLIVKESNDAGEAAWPMPLHQRYNEKLKATHCDMRNAVINSPYGGSITAALFLKKFIKKGVDWAHLDVAPSAWDFGKNISTGWGPASLYEVIVSGNLNEKK